jgi:hypothetical protein
MITARAVVGDGLDIPGFLLRRRRLKGSVDSSHYLDRDELAGIKLLRRQQDARGIKSAYLFVNERAEPFRRMGIARIGDHRRQLGAAVRVAAVMPRLGDKIGHGNSFVLKMNFGKPLYFAERLQTRPLKMQRYFV